MKMLDRLVVAAVPLIPKFIVRQVSSRYIAGPTLDDAVQVVRDLNEAGFCATLDVLGEFISTREEAEQAVEVYLQALDRIREEKLDSNISVKLTMLGLLLEPG